MRNELRLQNHPDLQTALSQLTSYIDAGDALHAADRILAVEDYISWQVLSDLHRLPAGGKDFTRQVQLFIDLDANGDTWAQIHNETVRQMSGPKDINAIRAIYVDVLNQTDNFLDDHIYPDQVVDVIETPAAQRAGSAASGQAAPQEAYAGDSWSDNLSGGGAAYQSAPGSAAYAQASQDAYAQASQGAYAQQSADARRSWQDDIRRNTASQREAYNNYKNAAYKNSQAYRNGYQTAEDERYRRSREWRDTMRQKEQKENEDRYANTTGFVLAAIGAFIAFVVLPARAWLVVIGLGALFRLLRKKR